MFALFPEQLLKALLSWGGPDEYSMILVAPWEMLSGFCMPVLKCCSAVLCSAAETQLKLLDCVVSGVRFLIGGCVWAHHRSVAVLCMPYKNRRNPMQPLFGARPVPYVPVRVTLGAWLAHWYTYAHPRCITSQQRRTFISVLWVSVEWSNRPCIRWCGTGGFHEQGQWFLLASAASSHFDFYLLLFSLSLLSFYRLVMLDLRLWTDRV